VIASAPATPTTTPPADLLYERFRSTRFFGSLNGLRCVAILAVIWHHTAGHHFDWAITHHGQHGVTLFFAISGFLITTLLLREIDKTGTVSLKKFYMRRTLRIFPLYYTTLLIYVALVFVMERGTPAGDAFWRHLPAYATYTANWFVDFEGHRVIFYFAWSLAAEEQFYLVWPWVQKCCRRGWPIAFMLVAMAFSFIAWNNYFGIPEGLLLTILQSIMPAICIGALLAHLLHERRSFVWLVNVLGRKPYALVYGVLFLAYLASPGSHLWVVHTLAALWVGACVMREDHWLARPLSLRPVAFLGTISYGMYMFHMLAKNGYDMVASRIGLNTLALKLGVAPVLLQFLGTAAIVTVIAALSFRYYESIFLKMKHKYTVVATSKRDPDPAA